jgi:hypothetical protein
MSAMVGSNESWLQLEKVKLTVRTIAKGNSLTFVTPGYHALVLRIGEILFEISVTLVEYYYRVDVLDSKLA